MARIATPHAGEFVYSTPTYFETMRIPLLAGRAFRESDTPQRTHVAVVSESFARRYFHGDALGRHLKLGKEIDEIVGICGDVQQHSGLSGDQGPLSVEPTVYLPVSQLSDGFVKLIHTWFSPKWVVRTGGPTADLTAQIRAAVAAVDPKLPVALFRTIDQLRNVHTGSQRYLAALFSILAGLALLLAAIGLYGLISQSMAQRKHELGIRLALGATRAADHRRGDAPRNTARHCGNWGRAWDVPDRGALPAKPAVGCARNGPGDVRCHRRNPRVGSRAGHHSAGAADSTYGPGRNVAQ